MSKPIVAVYQNNKWVFYNEKVEEIEPKKLDNKKIYVILPDDFFYFFQTEIATKRRIKQTINAYAKTIFPIENTHVGYLKNTNPIVGYIFLGNVEKIKDMLNRAEIITTFFVINYAINKKPFIYLSDTIIAICQGKVLGYFKGDYESVKGRINHPEDYEIIDARKDIKQSIEGFLKIIQQRKGKEVQLSFSDIESRSNLRKNIPLLTGICILLLLFLLGSFLRYKSYVSQLHAIETKLQGIYQEAFQGKTYQDPYGMLLYKAKQYESKKGNRIQPLEFIYALSKAKKHQVKIDYVSYDKAILKIKGSIENYDALLSYLSTFNKILGIEAKVEKTKKKKGMLEFSLIYTYDK